MRSWFTQRITLMELQLVDYKPLDFVMRQSFVWNFSNWTPVNQFTISHDSDVGSRRPDIVLFLNGLPIVVIELKSPDNLEENVWKAFNQIQTYKEQISRQPRGMKIGSLFQPKNLSILPPILVFGFMFNHYCESSALWAYFYRLVLPRFCPGLRENSIVLRGFIAL